MPYKSRPVLSSLIIFGSLAWAGASQAQQPSTLWSFTPRLEIRANYRESNQERFQLRFPFPPEFLPPGQVNGFLETVDAGGHAELSVVNLQLDAAYSNWFLARAKVHAVDKYRRNPTSSDRDVDADELFVRFGEMPEFLARPEGTSFFAQAGKAPKLERQPTRLLESYGLAANSFNRFEDVQLIVGGTVGRSLYWRLIGASGNPLFFRDPNALAGDNGIPEQRELNPDPSLKSGFPILYNAETEDLFFSTENLQFGQALGYRWQREDQTLGLDVILFHYRRNLADAAELTGTFYRGDLDLLDGPFDRGGLPTSGRRKEEYGGRLYGEWHGLTAIAQFTKQNVAGLQRQGYEVEAGYRFAVTQSVVRSFQPAVRLSGITNRFRGNGVIFPAVSIWWPWTKIDAGFRVGLPYNVDLTVERSKHNIGAPRKLDLSETLVTLRWRS